jgi:hypothetical protein
MIYLFDEHRKGLALVEVKGKLGYIDLNANLLVPPIYDSIDNIP